ncbi:MAG: hypothetical protein JXR45_21275, partial [Deltaproteobacteria bacterium]|nr:hypothetical protein [Deltaproteobacteria bacterium]
DPRYDIAFDGGTVEFSVVTVSIEIAGSGSTRYVVARLNEPAPINIPIQFRITADDGTIEELTVTFPANSTAMGIGFANDDNTIVEVLPDVYYEIDPLQGRVQF